MGCAVDESSGGDAAIRALQVIETLAAANQPASLDSLAAATGLGKTKTYRVLRALQDAGYVDHVGRSGYRVGGRSIGLASLIGPRPALLRRALPILNRLATMSSVTATLHLRSGTHRVLVLSAETTDPELRQAVRVGERAPLNQRAAAGWSSSRTCLWPTSMSSSPPGRAANRDPPTLGCVGSAATATTPRTSANHQGVSGIAAPLLDPDNGKPAGLVRDRRAGRAAL